MDLSLASQVVSAIRSVVGLKSVALHEPDLSGMEWEYLKECLDTTYVSSVGKFVDQFELGLANYTGAKYAVAMVNGTSALHISLLLAGVKPNDEVLVPAMSFVAIANAVVYCGAIPHFVDSEVNTLGIDPFKLTNYLANQAEIRQGQLVNKKTGCIIRALVPMHTFGHPSAMDALLKVAYDYKLTLIEDASESLGSFFGDRHTGLFGQMGVLSFNGNKIITTGGGGAIITNDPRIAKLAKHITTTAKVPHPWEYRHDQIGYNYRMPNINAALGCAQLENITEKINKKRKLYNKYKKAFSKMEGVSVINEPVGSKSNFWLQTIKLDAVYENLRDLILKQTNDHGVMTRPAWILLNELAPFIDAPSMDLECSYMLSRRLINIPSSSTLIV